MVCLYCSFKYGVDETERDGRAFTQLDEAGLHAPDHAVAAERGRDLADGGSTPGREQERWLNAIVRKVGSASAPVLISGERRGSGVQRSRCHICWTPSPVVARVAASSCVSPLFAKAGWCCCAVPCTRRWREEHGFAITSDHLEVTQPVALRELLKFDPARSCALIHQSQGTAAFTSSPICLSSTQPSI